MEPIQRAVRAEKYSTPTPIQAQAIPHLLGGRDLLGCAQTGTGKTAAFALPMLHRLANRPGPTLSRAPRALILTPTRELAAQIFDSFKTYGRFLRLSCAVVYGGVGQAPQVRALTRGVDILVATPGRLLDLIGQRYCDLSKIDIFVLDEADRMLDMGFLPDIRRVIKCLPSKRQSLFFSATMPPDIVDLAGRLLTDPARVHVAPNRPTADRIEQKVMFVDRANKPALLAELLRGDAVGRVLVFTRTKHGADRVARHLARERVNAAAIHGDKTQGARTQALERFRSGRARVLVATDIAARGIDVDGVTHVINYDLPMDPESYVHRIGRTARAGASGVAFTFCDVEERNYLRNVERLIRRQIPIEEDHPYRSAHVIEPVRFTESTRSHKPYRSSKSPGPRRSFGYGKSNAGASGKSRFHSKRSGSGGGSVFRGSRSSGR
jgi:ATP-dependent RNA helicase RhlE